MFLEAKVSRLIQYVDKAVEPLARAYQLEHVQKQIENMREDLQRRLRCRRSKCHLLLHHRSRCLLMKH
jgi:hypothetical protein